MRRHAPRQPGTVVGVASERDVLILSTDGGSKGPGDLLELLERALDATGSRNRGDVGERDVLYSGPQRAGGYVARAPEYSACHRL